MKLDIRLATMLLAAALVPAALADDTKIDGAWDVAVTIQTCGPVPMVIRNVHAMNLFISDGSLTEVAANAFRSSSVGQWKHAGDRTYTSTFRFFRYTPQLTVASTAKVTRTITLSHDGNSFTSTGTVEDFDAGNHLISSSCAVETATRLP